MDVKYRWVDPTSKKVYKGVENEVDIVVHKLVVNVDRPTLAVFLNSAIDALSRIFKDLRSILGIMISHRYR